jgi:hypothetical protein
MKQQQQQQQQQQGVKLWRVNKLIADLCRAFPPHHPLIPVDYQLTGQPVLIGGTMGTHSYILTGTQKGMEETFGSTCHGAGRARSRNNARNKLDYQQVFHLSTHLNYLLPSFKTSVSFSQISLFCRWVMWTGRSHLQMWHFWHFYTYKSENNRYIIKCENNRGSRA